ncbi:DUF6884 domain-containing protein [Listeria grayi]|uniref:DUF6884 domain-containing protein n=1 Tax=Listeria grayi TaxID=1641 RepID=UPI001628A8B4|nr:hypothetical protein [Listeria grayi]
MMIIPSGKPKIWDKQPEKGPVPAKEAYTGTFHRLCRDYAEMLGESYLILSPKYGFLKPDDLVTGSYDVRFDYNGVNAETISLPELQTAWKQLEINQEVIVMLGGKKFIRLSEKTAPEQQFVFPLIGARGIGEMQQMLKEAIRKQRPL